MAASVNLALQDPDAVNATRDGIDVSLVAEIARTKAREGLYRLAADLMRAPLDRRETQEILDSHDALVTIVLADEYRYTDSGWQAEGYAPASYLTRHVIRSLGVTPVDLAVAARRLADNL